MSWSLNFLGTPSPAFITTAEMKAHLRVVGSADDTYIDTLIAASLQFVQQYTGRLIYDQTGAVYYDAFPSSRELSLQCYFAEATAVGYFAHIDDEVYEEMPVADWVNNNRKKPSTIEAKTSWPTPANRAMAVRVSVTGGDTNYRPEIQHAVKIIVGHWYEQPDETSVGIPGAAKALLLQHRIFR